MIWTGEMWCIGISLVNYNGSGTVKAECSYQLKPEWYKLKAMR